MEDTEFEKKMNKTKSCNIGPASNLYCDRSKRKSYEINGSGRSLDLAMTRLKKSKLVNGETFAPSPTGRSLARSHNEMLVSECPSSIFGTDNASSVSMNFSHYELMRNLSNSNCCSNGTLSSTTGNGKVNQSDASGKMDQLERFFRSAEMWTSRFREGGPNAIKLPDVPDQ